MQKFCHKYSLSPLYIPRKTIEGYLNYFDYITVMKIISIKGIFLSDRTINVQFSRMQNKMYRSLVTIHYHTKCTSPLYPKLKSKNFSVYIFCCNLYLAINYVHIQQFQQKCTDMADPSQYDNTLEVKHFQQEMS